MVNVAAPRPEALTNVSVPILAGNRSLSVALVTALGPEFAKVNVKVVVCPIANDGVLATLVADKSALGPTTTVAVPVLLVRFSSLAEAGGKTVAAFTGAPLAIATALIKIVKVWLAGIVTVPVKVLPVMLLAVNVVAALEPVALTKAKLPSPAGKPSITLAAVA